MGRGAARGRPPAGPAGRPLGRLTVACLLALCPACTGRGATGADGAGGPATPAGDPSGRATGRLVATDVAVQPGCDDALAGAQSVVVTWTPAGRPGPQRVELSYLRDGFVSGAFVQTHVLPPAADSHHWQPLNPGRELRRIRVVTRHGDQWLPSAVVRFRGIDCG